MAVCPGKVVVITSCMRGYGNNYRNPFNIFINDVYVGHLGGGHGDMATGFIGTLDGSIAIPPLVPICDNLPYYDPPNYPPPESYRFDDSIINIGQNIIDFRHDENMPVYNSGTGGVMVVALYEISGGLLVNPVTMYSLGWATGGGGDQQVRFPFVCPGSPDINWLSTTPAGTTISPSQSALPCCECTATTPKPSTINSWIFTPPGVILGEPWYLSTTTAPDNVILTYDIATTTITTTPYITTTTITPAIPTTPIPKKCKCKEKNCNYLGF